MALEHMVWLTPKAGVDDAKMEEILASIRALTHFSRGQHHRPGQWRDPRCFGDAGEC
jgi:hypothetical protein